MGWPSWDSLESVTRVHRFFEISGIVCLGLLVVAEIFAYLYGHRKDELATMAQTRRERIISEDAATQAKQLKSEHEQEKVALQSQAESAQNLQQKTAQELQALKERDAPRKLTEEQGRKISLELRRSGKTFAVIVRNSPSDLESQDYAGQIASAITAAGWTITPPPFRIITRDATGLFITIKDVTKPAPEGAVLLQKALTSAGIDSSGVSDETMPDGAFELYVGQKPRANKPK